MTTPTGETPIGQIQVGDQMLAYNSQTGQSKAETVDHVFINHDMNLVDVTIAPVGPSVPPTPQTAGPPPKEGDAAVAAHGAQAPPASTIPETLHTTTEHPFLTTDRGFVDAAHLQVGEPVQRLDGSLGVVIAVTVTPGAAVRYNLTVHEWHTFAVGDGQWVVHNQECKLVQAAENVRTSGGKSRAAGAVADVTGSDGNLVARTSGSVTPVYGGVGKGATSPQCAECRLSKTLARMFGKGGLSGYTIDIGVSQVKGRAPCDSCSSTFQQLANHTGGTLRVWYNSLGKRGMKVEGPIMFSPKH